MEQPPPARLRVAFLGSGSAGNATAVECGGRCVLVDCGFSARETLRRLESCGIARESVEAVLVTHEHGDHVRGIEVLSRRLGVPVHATRGTLRRIRLNVAEESLSAGSRVSVAGFEVRVFGTSHDVEEPVGFAFRSPCGGTFGLATDSGVLTGDALEALADCEWVGLETNHDVGMLVEGPYPWFLKKRILSERGHLSNAAAAEALETLASGRTRRVVALHLSRTNNTPSAALRALCSRAEALSLPLSIGAVGQDRPRVQEPAA